MNAQTRNRYSNGKTAPIPGILRRAEPAQRAEFALWSETRPVSVDVATVRPVARDHHSVFPTICCVFEGKPRARPRHTSLSGGERAVVLSDE
ncbi:hypothetical protein [Xenorhabdus vietnamensis]|uniref:hypothetical protein n=1 Tax=Xenorhabdus vietnamensis TaxID=351656 RepID=UPI00111C5D77|nr:hypothetical protein [Xenorhabdus vietnamensis]